MPRPTGPTNPIVSGLAATLRERGHREKIDFMIALADKISTQTRRRPSISLTKLSRISKDSETVVVPGKVLDGILDKKITIAALSFSTKAMAGINKAGGHAITVDELIEKNPKGTGVRIVC